MRRTPAQATRLLLAGVILTAPVSCLAARELVFASFEAQEEFARWDVSGEAQLSPAHATDGDRSLHLTWREGRGLIARGFPVDWSAWHALRLDCHNPGPPVTLTLRAEDGAGKVAQSCYLHLRTGETTVEVPVAGLAEELDVSDIRLAHLRLDPPQERPVELFIDNLRLVLDAPPVAFVAAPLPQTPILQAPGNLVRNADFELGLLGWRLWGDWQEGRYLFGAGTGELAASGGSSAAIICTRLGKGEIFSETITAPVAGEYLLSVKSRGSLGGQIEYGLIAGGRNHVQGARATGQWQEHTLRVSLTQGQAAQVHLRSLAPGVVYFDEVRLQAPAQAEAAPAELAADADPANRLTNPGFEQGLAGWQMWGQWEGGDYEFADRGGGSPYRGEGAALIRCVRPGRGGVFRQIHSLPGDTYTLRAMARATEPGKIRLGLTYPGGEVFRDLSVDTRWQSYSITVASPREGDWWVYLMNIGATTVAFDEVRLTGTLPMAPSAGTGSETRPPASVRLTVREGFAERNGRRWFPVGVHDASAASLAGQDFDCAVVGGHLTAEELTAYADAGLTVLPDLTGVLRAHLPQRATAAALPLAGTASVVGWHVCSEPADPRWGVPPEEVRLASALLKDMLPSDLTCATISSDSASELYRFSGVVDVLMPVLGAADGEMAGALRTVRVARRACGTGHAVWAVVADRDGMPDGWRRATAYAGVLAGAGGVFLPGPDASEGWEECCLVAREFRALQPVLETAGRGDGAHCDDPSVVVGLWRRGDLVHVIALNISNRPVAQARITVPDAADGRARVLFEGREVPLEQGVITDTMGPLERHVYALPGPE